MPLRRPALLRGGVLAAPRRPARRADVRAGWAARERREGREEGGARAGAAAAARDADCVHSCAIHLSSGDHDGDRERRKKFLFFFF